LPSLSQTGIVGFLDNKGGIIGTGFVASKDGLIVTCTHVIEAISKSIKNDLSVSIKFAKIEKIYQAIVLRDFLFDSKKEDIAFLKLHEDLPCEVEPLKLGPSQGSENHNVISFGYPKLEDVEGLPAEGHVIGVSRYQGENVIAIESGNITKGYSGAPVFDEIYGWAIGLIVSIIPQDRMGRLEKTALAIPSETLKRINPNVECNELIDEIINVCRKQSEIEIMALGAKYISSLFVPRKGLDEILKEFLDNIDRTKKENDAIRVRNAKIPGENEKIKKYNQSVEEYNKDLPKDGKKKKKKKELKEMAEKPILNCLLFKGEAGIGKTNHLCHLCEKFGNEYPILFLSGGRMFLTGADSIEDEFRRSLDLIDDYYGAKLTEIEEISNLSGRYLILIIDAINECTNINKIKINLSQIISYWKERNIAFVISCRDIDWRFFDDETSLIDSIFFKEEVNYLSRSGTFMKEFSDEEFDMAWEKYKKYYKIKLRAATPP